MGKEKEEIQVQVRKSQERKIWWEALNGYRNKFRIPDAKHHNSWD